MRDPERRALPAPAVELGEDAAHPVKGVCKNPDFCIGGKIHILPAIVVCKSLLQKFILDP
jgi:hypothetical protein